MAPRGKNHGRLERRQRWMEQVREALVSRASTGEIATTLSKEWGVATRTVHTYIRMVREDLQKTRLMSLTQEQRAYEQNLVIAGIKRTVLEAWGRQGPGGKLTPDLARAQKGEHLLGLIYGVFPERLELSGPGGGPVSVAGDPGLTARLQKLLDTVIEERKRSGV